MAAAAVAVVSKEGSLKAVRWLTGRKSRMKEHVRICSVKELGQHLEPSMSVNSMMMTEALSSQSHMSEVCRCFGPFGPFGPFGH